MSLTLPRLFRGARILFAAATLAITANVQAAPRPVRIYPLDCGRIDIADMDPFADDGAYKGVHRQLVVSRYLIRHPEGDLLWDAGIGDRYAGPKGVQLLPGFVAHVPRRLEAQLERLGTRLGRIRFAAFSHEHVDHIGNANALTGAIWLLNRKEHAWTVRSNEGRPPPSMSLASRASIGWITQDTDIFGGGTVKIVQAPGHTPGHQVLLVRRTGQSPVILAGDLWHSRSNYAHDRVPRINTDRTETLRSMRKVRALAHSTGAEIWIGHAIGDLRAAATRQSRSRLNDRKRL